MSVRTDVVNLNVNINGDKGKDELNQLRKRSADLTAEMRNLKKGTEEYITASKELNQINDRMASLRAQIGLTALSQRELNQEMKRLQAIKQHLTPGTEEFKKLQKEIDAVGNRLRDVRTGMFGFKSVLNGLSKEVKQFGILAASYLGFEFLTSQIKNVIGAQKKLADENSNIAKTTSLTADEINRLGQEFKGMDTRTSNSRLRQFAEEAGKLGKDGYEDVKRFVDEANKIDVALGKDLGDEGINKIAKISGIFGNSMTAIASGINSVGQASAASESYQVDFAFRTAGTAKAAKLAAGDILGYAAALEVNGQTAEVAGTSINTFLLDFISKSNQFGKAAGFAKGELTKLINEKGVNEAFLQFLTRLQASTKSTEGFINKMSELGVDGARGANTMLVLAQNIDEVRKQQLLANTEIGKGTSVINEYNVNNNNFAATLDKLSKFVNGIITSSTFNKAVSALVEGADKLLRSIPPIVEWIQRNALAFKLWGLAILVNSNLLPRLISLIGSLIVGMKGLTIAQLASEIAFRAQMLWITSISLLQALWAGNTAKVRQEFQLLTQVLGRNPIGIFLVAAGAAVVALDAWATKTKALTKSELEHLDIIKKVSETAGPQLAQLALLRQNVQNVSLAEKDRIANAKKLQELMPEIFGNLTTEQILAGKVADAYERANKAIVAKSKARVFEGKLDDVASKMAELEEKIGMEASKQNVSPKRAPLRFGQTTAAFELLGDEGYRGNLVKYINQYNALLIKQETYLMNVSNAQKEVNEAQLSTETAKALAQGEETAAETKKREAEEKKAARAAATAEKKLETIAAKFARLKAEAQRLNDDADAAEESKDARQIQAVKDRYAKFLEKLDREIRSKKGNLLVDAQEYEALVAGLSDAQQQELTNLYKKQFEARSDKEYEQSLQNLSDFYDKERQVTIDAYVTGLLDRKAYKEKLKKIDADEETDTATIDADYFGTSKKAAKNAAGRKASSAQKQADASDAAAFKALEDAAYKAQRLVLTAMPGSNAELKAKRDLLNAKFDMDTQHLKKTSEAYETAHVQLNKDLAALDKEHLKTKIDQIDQVMQTLAGIFSSYVEFTNQKENAQLAKDKEVNNNKKANYDQQLKKKLISQKQYDTEIARLDAEMDSKQKALSARQAKRNKAVALFSAIMNTAIAIARAFADYAWPASIAVAALAGAAGAAQIAAISSSKVPTGRKGLIVQGSSHEQGGIDMIDRGTGRHVANIEGGEPVMVLSKDTYANNRDLINELIFNSQQRNGARVSAPWWNDSPVPVNASRIIPLLRTGGVVGPAGSTPAAAPSIGSETAISNALLNQLVQKQDATIQAIQEQNKQLRAYVVLQDVTDSQDLLKKAKSVAGIKQAA